MSAHLCLGRCTLACTALVSTDMDIAEMFCTMLLSIMPPCCICTGKRMDWCLWFGCTKWKADSLLDIGIIIQCIGSECYILCSVCSRMQVISTADLTVVQEVMSVDAAQTLLAELQK